jgi:hypothetical protein
MIDNDVLDCLCDLTENFETNNQKLRNLNFSKNLNISDTSMAKLV